jgi:hypothetical protein
LALAGGTADINPTTYAAAVGSATVWVRVSQGINCGSVAKLNININAAVNAGNTTKVTFCKNEDSLDLTTKLGSGIATTGKWTPALPSGTNSFNPKTDAPGRYTYTLTGTAPCPNSSAILEVSVSPIANAGQDADALTLCKSDRAVDIFLLLKNSPASNGTWQPALASGGNMFDPAKDAPGIYTYTVKGVAPCASASASINIAITDLQSMLGNTIIDTGNTICDDNFTGNHIVDDLKNMDHSKLIANPNQYTFSYYANDRLSPRINNTQNYNLGSTMPATVYVKILSATGCSAVAKMIYSLRSATPLLVASQTLLNCDNDAKPSDGLSSFNLQSTQAGFNTDNSTTFDYYTTLNGAKTSLASDKIANITAYNNTRNNQVVYVRIQQKDFCPSIASINLKVNTPPNAGANTQLALCKNSGLVDLLPKLGNGIKGSGQWSPALVSNSSYFDPTKDQAGKYTYTLPGTAPCGNATAEIEVLVHEVPVAGKNAKITLCQSDAPVDLFLKLGATAALGGTWSPALSQGILNPKTDKSGTYTYTVSGTAPCVDATAKVEVTIVPLANAGQDTRIAICKTDAPFALLSRLAGNPSAGGIWTPALANNGVFDPALDAPGEYTYTLSGTATCASMSSKLTIDMMDIKLKDANSFVQLENNLCDEFFNGVHKVDLGQMDHSKLVENHTQYQYSYYQDAAAQKPIATNLYDLGPILPATVYVKITNSNGCSVVAPMQYSNPKLTPLIKPEHMMSECDNDQKPNNDYFTFKPQDSKKEFNADPSTSFEYYTSFDAAKLKQTAFKLSDAQLLAFQNTIAKAQTLYVRVQQPGFCPVISTLKLEVKRIPMAEFLPADKFCPSSQKNVKLEAKSGLVEYLWQNAAGQNLGTTASILVNKNGIYTLTTKGFNGCTNTEKIDRPIHLATYYNVPVNKCFRV